MTFRKHEDPDLVNLFKDRPFQGQDPDNAKIVFLSSDANYSPQILKNKDFRPFILEYHKDGVVFWKNPEYRWCHHPFLLPCFPFDKRKDGVKFHRNFSGLELDPEIYAEHISFLELLDVPTSGTKSEDIDQFDKLLSLKHLLYVDKLINDGGHKLFFVSNGVLRDIARIRKIYPCNDLFAWVKFFTVGSSNQFIKDAINGNGNKIKKIYHFSYPKIHSQLTKIKSEIDHWLGYN